MPRTETPPNKYTLYGWEVSPFTAKVNAYLSYKKIPFITSAPSMLKLKRVIEPKVGKIIMPVIMDEKGEVTQDSTVIIDRLENYYPDNPIIPSSPKQQFVAMLMELCGDEWLTMAALHYRWNYPKNRKFILNEFGQCALPYFPSILQRKVASVFAQKMKGYLPILGITEKTHGALEDNTHKILSLLNRHLEQHPYLLGDKPCVGDFSLYGPIYAHLHRDPSPKNLVSNYPNTMGWVTRLLNNNHDDQGNFLANDEIPSTLMPLIELIIEQQFPLISDSMSAISRWSNENPDKRKLPQKIGTSTLKIENACASRYTLTYPYWMFQRISDAYQNFDTKGKNEIKKITYGLSTSSKSCMGLLDRKSKYRVQLKRCRLYLE